MYLKRFADNKRRIVMVSRDQNKRFHTDIKKACVQTDYYAVETDNGRSQEVEGFLSSIEGDASAAIERMLGGEFPPSAADRKAVAAFIGFQCLRGDETRQGYEQVFDTLTKITLSNTTKQSFIKDFYKREGREPTEGEIAAQKRILSNLDTISIKPHQNESIRIMLELAPEIAAIMLKRRWFLNDHGEPCLLTSDTPVMKWSKPTGSAAFYGRGWATADEIWMPLSPRHSLCLARTEEFKEQVVHLGCKIGPEQGAAMNKLVAYKARRWIFHHPATDPLNGITLPPIDPVMQIDGATGRIIPDDW